MPWLKATVRAQDRRIDFFMAARRPHRRPSRADAAPRIRQFATSLSVDIHTLHPTFDPFGGGGLTATAIDVACFFSALFSGRVFDKPESLGLMLLDALPTRGVPCGHRTGLAKVEINGHPAFGHGTLRNGAESSHRTSD